MDITGHFILVLYRTPNTHTHTDSLTLYIHNGFLLSHTTSTRTTKEIKERHNYTFERYIKLLSD